MVVIVMFSGGPDSVYVLYHYLVKTSHIVHAHRIDMRYPSEPRWKEENEATERIYKYCREHYRAFTSSTTLYEYPFGAYVGWDSDLICLVSLRVAANLANRFRRHRVKVAVGWNCDDRLRPSVARRIERKVTNNLFKACHDSLPDEFRKQIQDKIEYVLMDLGMYKKDIYLGLPEELWNMSWSCRTPRSGKPCGRCHACKLRMYVEKKYPKRNDTEKGREYTTH